MITLGFLWKYKLLILKASLPLSLILLLGFAFLLVGYNLEIAARGFESRYALEIFMKTGSSPESLDTLQQFLKAQPAYDKIEIVSQDAALDRMTQILGSDPTEALGYNPLPMSVIFYPKNTYKNRTYLEILKDQVEVIPAVEKGVFAGEWLQELEKFNSIFVKITAFFLLLVLFAYLLLFHMVLNHLWLKHQETAGKMHLLGVSRLGLRLPVYFWSLITALLTSVLALAILGIISNLVSQNFLALRFFLPRHVFAIAMTFTSVTVLLTIFKRMKIPTYE
jgi:cell division protein FtsX